MALYDRQSSGAPIISSATSAAAARCRHECEWHYLLHTDGQTFDVLLILTAIQYEEGALLHIAWNDITITQRKATETQLRINEEKFRTFVEDANDQRD